MNTHFDIAVVGAGAAGIAAAISAARAGCTTLLTDQRASGGGTGGFSGLTTLCGLFDDKGEYINGGFAREFAEAIAETKPRQMGKVWVLSYRPEKFRAVTAKMFAKEPNLQTQWSTPLTDVTKSGNRITSLNGIEVGAVIDCSGTAEVADAIDAKCLTTDDSTQSGAIIFELRHVERLIRTPAEAAQVLLPLARAGLPPVHLQPCIEPRTFTAKFSGRANQVPEVIRFLRANVPGFENCNTEQTEFFVSRRSGRMIVGKYLLTGRDVLAGRKFDDTVASCSWPIEQWNEKGVARYGYLPSGTYYQIPARSLCAATIENLFMAGKTISADADAIASARVMGCCLTTGAAAGKLAADYIRSLHHAQPVALTGGAQ